MSKKKKDLEEELALPDRYIPSKKELLRIKDIGVLPEDSNILEFLLMDKDGKEFEAYFNLGELPEQFLTQSVFYEQENPLLH